MKSQTSDPITEQLYQAILKDNTFNYATYANRGVYQKNRKEPFKQVEKDKSCHSCRKQKEGTLVDYKKPPTYSPLNFVKEVADKIGSFIVSLKNIFHNHFEYGRILADFL